VQAPLSHPFFAFKRNWRFFPGIRGGLEEPTGFPLSIGRRVKHMTTEELIEEASNNRKWTKMREDGGFPLSEMMQELEDGRFEQLEREIQKRKTDSPYPQVERYASLSVDELKEALATPLDKAHIEGLHHLGHLDVALIGDAHERRLMREELERQLAAGRAR
jgi:hypothetical protein